MKLSELNPRLQAQVAAQLYPAHPRKAPQHAQDGSGPKIRQKRVGSLNRLESAFLERLKASYGPDRVLSQALTLSLANGCTFRPDFVVVQEMTETGLVGLMAFETKGPFAYEDGLIKLKVAARTYPWIRFYLVTRGPDGRWNELLVLP